MRLWAIRGVYRDEVGEAKELLQRSIANALPCLFLGAERGALVVEDLHPEGTSTGGNSGSDPPVAYEPEGLPREMYPEVSRASYGGALSGMASDEAV